DACRRLFSSRRVRKDCSTLPAWRTSALLKRTKSERSAETLQSSVSPLARSSSRRAARLKNCAFIGTPARLVVARQGAPALEVLAQLLGGARLRRVGHLVAEVCRAQVRRHRDRQRVVQLGAQVGPRGGTADIDQ